MKKKIRNLAQGDWFIATLSGAQAVFIACECSRDGATRFCVDLNTGLAGGWDCELEVERISDYRKYIALLKAED